MNIWGLHLFKKILHSFLWWGWTIAQNTSATAIACPSHRDVNTSLLLHLKDDANLKQESWECELQNYTKNAWARIWYSSRDWIVPFLEFLCRVILCVNLCDLKVLAMYWIDSEVIQAFDCNKEKNSDHKSWQESLIFKDCKTNGYKDIVNTLCCKDIDDKSSINMNKTCWQWMLWQPFLWKTSNTKPLTDRSGLFVC